MSAGVSQITGVSIVCSIVWFRRRSKKTSKLRVTGLCAGNSPLTGEFPTQKAINAENVSIWWRHHVRQFDFIVTRIVINDAHAATTQLRLSGLHRWNLDEQFHPTLYYACDYLSMLRIKLTHVIKGASSLFIKICCKAKWNSNRIRIRLKIVSEVCSWSNATVIV